MKCKVITYFICVYFRKNNTVQLWDHNIMNKHNETNDLTEFQDEP